MTRQTDVPAGDDTPISYGVIQALAQLQNRPPTALSPLYDSIDPDVFETAFGTGSATSLRFTYNGSHVHVWRRTDGRLMLALDGDDRHSSP